MLGKVLFSVHPEEFLYLHHMKKLVRISTEYGPSKLGKDGTLIYLFLHNWEKQIGQ